MSLEKVFDRKQVKEEAEKTPLTIGEMQGMFHDYEIRVFNVETNELEIATKHNATTADLLSVIKYYEDNFTIDKERAKSEIKFYKKALERIANEFGVVDPIQLIMKAENDEENYVDILIKIIRERLATEEITSGKLLNAANKMAKEVSESRIIKK